MNKTNSVQYPQFADFGRNSSQIAQPCPKEGAKLPKNTFISFGMRHFSRISPSFPRVGFVIVTICHAIWRKNPRKRVRQADFTCLCHIGPFLSSSY